ncbi:MAG: cytochrome P450 [Myxococcota bacterium]|nr:cytochrome P450 [Myxococcales bacterium]
MTEPLAFNPLDPAFRRDPYDVYARGRAARVVAHEGLPLPLRSVFRYEDIQRVLRDHETFSNEIVPPALRTEDTEGPPPQSMLGSDPPRHTRLRALVSSAFTPRIVARLEPRMHEVADELVDAALDKGEVDLVEALTYPLPVVVIAEIIGVPPEDRAQFKEWSDRIVSTLGLGLLDGGDPDRMRRQMALLTEMRAYFVPLADERRRAPKDDLLTGLVQARHEGSKLDEDEMLTMLVLLLVAGNETTTTLIGNAAIELMARPDDADALRADPSLLPGAIDEVLRFSAPVQFDPRRVVRDVEVGDATLRAGDLVLCWLASGNRDERVFERPDAFDLRRARNAHLSFGYGTHYCIGANLARLEARVAIGALLRGTRRIERVNDDPLPLHGSPVFRAFTEIPVRLARR